MSECIKVTKIYDLLWSHMVHTTYEGKIGTIQAILDPSVEIGPFRFKLVLISEVRSKLANIETSGSNWDSILNFCSKLMLI